MDAWISAGEPGSDSLAYVLALLLVRRRVLVEEPSFDDQASVGEPAHWTLVCNADGRKWNVPLAQPSPDVLPELQSELNALLFTEE